MKKIFIVKAVVILAVVLFVVSMPVQAGNTNTIKVVQKVPTCIKYCTNYDDMMAEKWQQADSVQVFTKSRAKQMWWGGNDFKFDTGNKHTNKLLKKYAFAVMYNDTLLLNTGLYTDRGVRFNTGYTRGYRMKDGRLLITYFNVKEAGSRAMMGGAFGLVGSLIASASNSKLIKQDVCYIIMHGEKKAFIIDDKQMSTLLAGRQDLLSEYYAVEKKNRLHADVIMPLLEKAGIL